MNNNIINAILYGLAEKVSSKTFSAKTL